ncbi:hypothetical protein SBADM41S_04471 [Streptomyces badius]
MRARIRCGDFADPAAGPDRAPGSARCGADRPVQRSAARIAPSMSGKATEKPESSSFAGITR